MSTPFSHLDADGAARMVSVAHKPDLARRAVASGLIALAPATVQALRDHALPKGDVLTVAKLAGIQAAKLTSHIIPLCHPLPLHHVDVSFEVRSDGVAIRATAVTIGKTGVEMEALTAASGAALAIYDMCKAVDKGMVIGPIRLELKEKRELTGDASAATNAANAEKTTEPVL